MCGDPGIQYDTTINRWNPVQGVGAHQLEQPVLRVHVPRRHGLQPGQPEPDDASCDEDGQLRRRRRSGARRRSRSSPRRSSSTTPTIRPAKIAQQQPPVPPARPRLREPRRAAHVPGPALRQRGGAQRRGGDHLADVRRGLPHERRDRGGDGAVPALPPEPRAVPRGDRHAQGGGRGGRRHTACSATSGRRTREVWAEALELGRRHGYKNAQVTVLAPTGTIAFMMDCDTTGVEPDIALVKYKKLVGGGLLKIVNNTVPMALARLGYDEAPVARRSSPTSTSTRRSRARPRLRAGAPAGVRLRVPARQRQALDPVDGPHPHDGRRAALPVGRDQQDGEPARPTPASTT